MTLPVNGKDLTQRPDVAGTQQKQSTIGGALFNPLYKTDNYAMIILAPFLPELGHGMYGVVNRDTKVVEASVREYGAALLATKQLQEAYLTATADEQNPQ